MHKLKTKTYKYYAKPVKVKVGEELAQSAIMIDGMY